LPAIALRALEAKRESRAIEFKAEFDPGSNGPWCELLKDIVAMANSGGGVIAIGLSSGGRPSGADVSGVLALDPAEFCNKIHAYTGVHFSEFELAEASKDGHRLALLVIENAESPIVFNRPGTYSVGDGKQKTAFSAGSVYFRHGAKSEPGNTADVAVALQRRLDKLRREWLSGVRRVVEAPVGSTVSVLPPEVRSSTSPTATPIRIVDDAAAPAFRLLDPDDTHPFRQKELLAELRNRLPRETPLNGYDLLAVRKVHGIDGSLKFCHKPRFGSPQYSIHFVEWVLERFSSDQNLFIDAKRALKKGGAG